ncbi:hypothetical protein BN2537_16297 [Streptomyces venezuelae]|nr:hypothetical protein BN2537_16297 [Streptomyces venezuelae]
MPAVDPRRTAVFVRRTRPPRTAERYRDGVVSVSRRKAVAKCWDDE